MKRLAMAVGLWLGICGAAVASTSTMDGPMTDGNAAIGQAYNKNFTLDTSAHDVDYLALQMNYSPGVYASPTFNDGVASTGNLTVVSFAFLSSATATTNITITSNTALGSQSRPGGPPAVLFVAGRNLTNGVEWNYDVNFATNSACNLAAAINAYTAYVSTCTGSVVFSTAPTYGTFWNQGVASSTQAALTVANGGFTGGQDNATFTINGVTLVANRNWYPLTSNTITATSIAAAIVSSAATMGVTASSVGGVVFTTSTAVGTITNYTITSSTQSRLSTVNMTGGANASFALGGQTISAPAHGLPVAFAVSVSTVSGTSKLMYSTATIGGTAVELTQGVTYYVIPVSANSISLATTSAGAVAGTAITFVSSQTKTTTDTYTLFAPATTATGSFGIWASNDGSQYQQVGSSTTNIPSVSPSTATFIDTGLFDWRFYQLRVVAPTQGAMPVSGIVHGERR